MTLDYLAFLEEKQGDLSATRQHIEAALEEDPPSVDRGKVLLRQDWAAETVRVLERVIARRPQNSEPRNLLARSYQTLGRKQEAAREFAEFERRKTRQLQMLHL